MNNVTEIIEKAKELGELVKNSTQVKELAAAKTAYEENAEMQKLIGEFNLHKMSIAAISKQENPDEKRLAEHEDKLHNVYDKIMQAEVMTEYQLKSQAVESLVAEINTIINFYITGETPQGCTGSCSTCGGCSTK